MVDHLAFKLLLGTKNFDSSLHSTKTASIGVFKLRKLKSV